MREAVLLVILLAFTAGCLRSDDVAPFAEDAGESAAMADAIETREMAFVEPANVGAVGYALTTSGRKIHDIRPEGSQSVLLEITASSPGDDVAPPRMAFAAGVSKNTPVRVSEPDARGVYVLRLEESQYGPGELWLGYGPRGGEPTVLAAVDITVRVSYFATPFTPADWTSVT